MNTQIASFANRSYEVTMSSLEFAQLMGKRHKNVVADIIKMHKELGTEDALLRSERTYMHYQDRQTYTYYDLSELECMILVTGYGRKFCVPLVDHWIELKRRAEQRHQSMMEDAMVALRASLERELAERKRQLAEAAMPQGDNYHDLEVTKVHPYAWSDAIH